MLLGRIRAAVASDRVAPSEYALVMQQLARVTPREGEVMELLLSGKMSKEIAAAMRISIRTVEGHRRKLLQKMDVSSSAQLVRAVCRARAAQAAV